MIINTIKKNKQNPKKVQEIIQLVINQGGIAYAEKKMHEFKDLALKELNEIPSSEAKDSFIGLINYSINRIN